MQVKKLSLEQGAREAEGAAVIIDVFRAFTCAPILFHLGVEKILFVSEPEQGLALKNSQPDLILVGEVNAVPLEGYDFGNSPMELLSHDPSFFRGRTVVHRTSAGVQGTLIAAKRADPVLLAGFVNARATADHVRRIAPAVVSVVAMGRNMAEPAAEDDQCARYISSLLGQGTYDPRQALVEMVASPTTALFTSGRRPYLPAEDPIICLQRDIFDIVIQAANEDGQVVARPIPAAPRPDGTQPLPAAS